MYRKHLAIIAWVVLSIWVFCTLIHAPFALFQLSTHHKKTTYKLKYKKEKQLVKLTLPAQHKEFIRINKKEFIWQGEWYDIEDLSEKDGLLHIVAHPDKKEEKFQKRLAKALEHSQQQSEKGKNNIKYELKESYISRTEFLFIPPCHTFLIQNHLYFATQSISLSLLKPPPEHTA